MFPEYVHITELVHISNEAGDMDVMVTFVFLFSIPRCLFLTLKNLPPGLSMCCSYLKDEKEKWGNAFEVGLP